MTIFVIIESSISLFISIIFAALSPCSANQICRWGTWETCSWSQDTRQSLSYCPPKQGAPLGQNFGTFHPVFHYCTFFLRVCHTLSILTIQTFFSISGHPTPTTYLHSSKGQIKVRYQPLIVDKRYRLGEPKEKYIIWNKNLLPIPKVGQYVSFHWDQVAQILTKGDLANLRKYTQKTLNCIWVVKAPFH